jgi:hypothetical protein
MSGQPSFLVGALAFILLAGCVAAPCRYAITGTVTISVDPSRDAPPLRMVIADALRPFGFTGGDREHDGPYFYSLGGHGFMPKERIDVRLDPESRQIGLIDYNHSTQSDFVKQVIESIGHQTASVYGTKVNFIPRTNRWTDCLGP